ncbi:MAG: hypothetical protein A2431_03575 [Candidatus Zambryskibacteria bacterium RIFOXYC1_FULL_39_10]|uniref:Uncharacterized protein n=1 Tax=Candidatus Zambryskibacteria bacterium RIFOXYC1_FULL_39_10 TaxID=1802779 RepID=A0A1G2UYG6_9BACT|nr:MAG: hypothetical protein A2431_03575 [Candidatus Zambryskibacteria bacterium RIFOXYC1_FULL_39_10]OHB16800.1 MAG: hypothetical protein A2605_01275 [Candidatus Zambryskibacteria bacterium RIFOXYD1_FULL_39_35]
MKDLSVLAEMVEIPLHEFEAAQEASKEVTCNASTVVEAEDEYLDAVAGSTKEANALKRWLELCSTIEEVIDVYWTVMSLWEKDLTLLKMIELYEKE